MCKWLSLLVLSVLFFNCAYNNVLLARGPQSKVHLSVYYESLCPDSKKFILNQLLPTMEEMHRNIKIKLVPFGKAKSVDYGFSSFQCQHGPSECLGNMIQDCTLYHMKDRSDLDKVKYVACEMASQAGAKGSFECVKKAKVPVELVKKCMHSGKGIILQLESEYYTQTATGPPWPKFIPTIIANKEFNQEFQDYALVDLLGIVCSKLQEVQTCATIYNQIALDQLMDWDRKRGRINANATHIF